MANSVKPGRNLIGSVDGGDVPTVAMLARSVTYGWGAYWGGRYGLLAAMLPDLLVESRAVLRDCPVAERPKAVGLAVQIHQLTAGTAPTAVWLSPDPASCAGAEARSWPPPARIGW